MRKIHKKILTDELKRPVAVQIDYADWLRIEEMMSGGLPEGKPADLAPFRGVLQLREDPLTYQRRIRGEWPR